jgi:DNA-binding CsgD family transcriptional regulator
MSPSDNVSLTYPSKKEFQRLGEIMHLARLVDHAGRLSDLTGLIGQWIPHQYAGCGIFNIRKCELSVGYSSYGREFAALYQTQGFLTDPSIQLLQSTHVSMTSSDDVPSLDVPRAVLSLKLDFGIKTCLSAGIRGALGVCSYFVFSNFEKKTQARLRTLLYIVGPHLHLAYMRATKPIPGRAEHDTPLTLTPREEEIMKWVAEGKTNWEISIILRVSLNTVKFHLKNIYDKLGGVENRWDAIARWQWYSAGLISDPHLQHHRAASDQTSPLSQ